MKRLDCTGARVVALTVMLSSCGGSGTPPPARSNPSGTGDRITGNERLGWNQAAADAGQLARLRYAAYVDGNRVELADVSCGELIGGVSACSSRMPSMAPGAHTIVVVSFVVDGGKVIESSRTSPIRLTLSGATERVP
jgi:hypothetical protein